MPEEEPIREPETLERVRFEDCDPFGHLNNAKYLSYFTNARERHVAEFYGFELHGLSRTEGLNWFVRRAQVEFMRPVDYGSEVLIRTRLIRFSQIAILIEALMMDKGAENLHSICWMDLIFVDLKSGRPARHGADLMALFHGVHFNEGEIECDNFPRRVKQIRSGVRAQS
jgi:acyl-CoA thioester hydrolase